MKTLIIGDIVGKLGRKAVKQYLQDVDRKSYDLIIANGENSASGFGITDRVYSELINAGVHIITGGNHTWDRPDTALHINRWDNFIRPLNHNGDALGVGYKTVEIYGKEYTIISLLGRVFMGFADDPFKAFDKIYDSIKDTFIIIDFHAEATAEKVAFAHYVSERANVVYGTHTHVQTNDLRLLNDNLLYITDVGMCGSADGCIGMEASGSIERFTSFQKPKMKVEVNGKKMFNAIEFVEENNKIISYKIINIVS